MSTPITTLNASPDEWTLDIFGQQTSTAVTTPSVFCFPLRDPDDLPQLVATLTHGLDKLAKSFPWVAGRVVNEGKTTVSSGVFKIKPDGRIPRLIVRDLRAALGAPTLAALEVANFPTSMLDEDLFSPVRVLPGNADEDRSPVLILQVSLMDGCLLLNIVGNHQALDGTGQEQVTYLLDKACRGEAFTEEEIAVGNLSRADVVRPLDDSWQPSPDSPYLKPAPSFNQPAAGAVPAPALRWTDVAFSGSALACLKAEASRDVESGYVSTDDALTALIWQSLARARLARLPPSTTSTVSRASNPRRYLGIPATYPGFVSNNAQSTQTLGTLVERSLGSVAAELRAAVDPESSNLGQTTREYATLLHRAADKDSVSANALDLDRDLMVSSWAGQRSYSFDFGFGLGRPLAFRRTLMPPVPSLGFLLPKRPDGEVVLNICAREDDLERLSLDAYFVKYGSFID